MIDAGFADLHKTRPAHDEVSVTEIAGRVRDKIAIVGDDVIMTGGTLLANVAALKEHGVNDVWVFAARALLRRCPAPLRGQRHLGILVTDTVPVDPASAPRTSPCSRSRPCSPERS